MDIPPILQKHYQNLCTSCGVCVAACPQGVLKIGPSQDNILIPKQDELKQCSGCGLCIKVCAGIEPTIDGEWSERNHKDCVIGHYQTVYTGHATDLEIRRNASSGGIVTALLLGLLDNGSIDGALVTVPGMEDVYIDKTVLAKTSEEIIFSSKSRYTQVDYAAGLRDLFDAKDGRYAVVGLPCHIASITKWSKISIDLRNKIYLTIGLFCGRGSSSELPKFIAKSIGINPSQVRAIDYRSGNWSDYGFKFFGDFGEKWIKSNGSIISKIWSSYFFCPTRCLICNDGFAENADISVGDAWNLPKADPILGTSLIITRTETGQKTLGDLAKRKKLHLTSATLKDILRSQPSIVRFKKTSFPARIRLWRVLGKSIPDIKDIPYPHKIGFQIKEYVSGINILVTTKLSILLQRWGLLHRIPTKVLVFFLRILQKMKLYG